MYAKQINLKPLAFWDLIGWVLENAPLLTFYAASLLKLRKWFRQKLNEPGRLILTILKHSRGRRYKFIRILPESCLWPMVEGKPFYKYRIYRVTYHVPTVQAGAK
jgi:hypothetical protein